MKTEEETEEELELMDSITQLWEEIPNQYRKIVADLIESEIELEKISNR
jgi:hypothetical protein